MEETEEEEAEAGETEVSGEREPWLPTTFHGNGQYRRVWNSTQSVRFRSSLRIAMISYILWGIFRRS